MRRSFAVALLLASLYFLVHTMGLDSPARRVPSLVIVPLVLLLAVEAVRELRCKEPPSAGARAGARSALLWTMALPLLISLSGMIAGPALYVLAYLRLRAREQLWLSAVVAAMLALSLAGLFRWVFVVSASRGSLLSLL